MLTTMSGNLAATPSSSLGTGHEVASGPSQFSKIAPGIRSSEVVEFAPEELLGPLNEVERKHAPKKLYVIGDEGLLRTGRRVSVVGSRKASWASLKRSRKLARALVAHGITVVSGLAAGIDTAAHLAAIEQGGRTIAVLGTPVHQAYPKENSDLHERIMRDHAAVSQFPAEVPVARHNFPMRNRTMALLSNATVIVAADQRSGAFYQGWEALRLGRELLIMESLLSTKIPEIEQLMHYGAQVLSDANLTHWLSSLHERVVDLDLVLD